MAWFLTNEGKRRLLAVEIPAIERYNADRDEQFKIRIVERVDSLVLRYRLMPLEDVYELETVLPEGYPGSAPITKVLTPLRPSPHQFRNQTLCLRGLSRWTEDDWDPARFTAVFEVQSAWRWLACYEVWCTFKYWPIPEESPLNRNPR